MVLSLGPGKFYGGSLPRPRFYGDVRFNDQRVDPPLPAMDPLMAWAREAHWSMGGLGSERYRLQGKIEGKIENLVKRKEREKSSEKKPSKISTASPWEEDEVVLHSPSPPLSPVSIKRRRVVGLVDEAEVPRVKRVARKLGNEFDRSAKDSGMRSESRSTTNKNSDPNTMQAKKKRGKLIKGGKVVGGALVEAAPSVRCSPRLARRRSAT